MRWGREGMRKQAGGHCIFEGSGWKAENSGLGPTGTGL